MHGPFATLKFLLNHTLSADAVPYSLRFESTMTMWLFFCQKFFRQCYLVDFSREKRTLKIISYSSNSPVEKQNFLKMEHSFTHFYCFDFVRFAINFRIFRQTKHLIHVENRILSRVLNLKKNRFLFILFLVFEVSRSNEYEQ